MMTRRWPVGSALALGAALVLGSCVTSDPRSSADSSAASAGSTPDRQRNSPTLTVAGNAPSTVSPAMISRLDPTPACRGGRRTIEVAGRGVRIAEPRSRGPVPLVIAIHGYKETPERLASFSGLDALADSGSALIAYPEGSPLDLGFGWNSGARRFATRSADDVGVLLGVVDDLVESGCASPEAVYIVGESNGGGMALRAACDRRMAGRLAGVVLLNPAIDEGVLATCSGRAPALEVLAAVGRLDQIIPVDGSRQPFLAVTEWFPRIARVLATCSLVETEASDVEDYVTVVRGLDCARCVELFESADGGHTWPGSSTALNGAPIGSFDLRDAIASRVGRRRGDCES